MDPLSWLLCLLFFLVLVQAFHLITRRKGRTDKLPPGPASIPIFGNLFHLGNKNLPWIAISDKNAALDVGWSYSFDWKLEDGVTPERLYMEDKYGLVLHKAQPLRAIPIST